MEVCLSSLCVIVDLETAQDRVHLHFLHLWQLVKQVLDGCCACLARSGQCPVWRLILHLCFLQMMQICWPNQASSLPVNLQFTQE